MLCFTGRFVCEKMRESQCICQEPVNTGERSWGWVCCCSCIYCCGAGLVVCSRIGVRRWGFAARRQVFGGLRGVFLVATEPVVLSSTLAAHTSKICLRRKALAGSAAKHADKEPRPVLPHHPIAGGAAAPSRHPHFMISFIIITRFWLENNKNPPAAAALLLPKPGKPWPCQR